METSYIIGAAVGGSYLLGHYFIKTGRSKKCPKCGKWFAIKEVKSEIVGKTDTFKSESYHEETWNPNSGHRFKRIIPFTLHE